MKILVLEDDVETASALRTGLEREGHEVVAAFDIASANGAIDAASFDAAVLDVCLPDGSGYDVLARMRDRLPEAFGLILTARGTIEARVEGLDRGADDYLVKPFAFAELAARIRALERRPRVDPPRVTIGGLEIDTSRRIATANGSRLDLTPIEFGLLTMLVRSRNEVVTRGTLLREVWGYDFNPTTNVVDVHVNRLRRKLEAEGMRDFVRTIRGKGYALA